MIVPSYSDAQILKELHEDLTVIKGNARKRSKKKLIKIVASGMTSKEFVDEYEEVSPNHNRWFVTNTIKANRRGRLLHVLVVLLTLIKARIISLFEVQDGEVYIFLGCMHMSYHV